MHSLLFAMLMAATSAPPPPPPPPSFPAGAPSSIGRPHSCASFYPPGALLDGIEGATVMSFTVDTTGHVADPKIAHSSGNEDLDAESLVCVKTWLYKPETRDGAPVAAPWQAQVLWKLHAPLKVLSAPHCALPPTARSRPAGSKTMVVYDVTPDGMPMNVMVQAPSGDDALDAVVVDCIAKWRMETPLKDGEPTSVHMSTSVTWTRPD